MANNKKKTIYTYSTAATLNPAVRQEVLPKIGHGTSSQAKLRPDAADIYHNGALYLTDNAIHKCSLHTCNLLLKSINLLPAIQRPAIIQSQTTNNSRLGLGNTLVQISQLPAAIETSAERLDISVHRVARDTAVQLLLLDVLNGGGYGRRGLVFAAGEGNARRIEVQ
jgi:hypothetical protein